MGRRHSSQTYLLEVFSSVSLTDWAPIVLNPHAACWPRPAVNIWKAGCLVSFVGVNRDRPANSLVPDVPLHRRFDPQVFIQQTNVDPMLKLF
jgi:hypothetical protein